MERIRMIRSTESECTVYILAQAVCGHRDSYHLTREISDYFRNFFPPSQNWVNFSLVLQLVAFRVIVRRDVSNFGGVTLKVVPRTADNRPSLNAILHKSKNSQNRNYSYAQTAERLHHSCFGYVFVYI